MVSPSDARITNGRVGRHRAVSGKRPRTAMAAFVTHSNVKEVKDCITNLKHTYVWRTYSPSVFHRLRVHEFLRVKRVNPQPCSAARYSRLKSEGSLAFMRERADSQRKRVDYYSISDWYCTYVGT